jgi:hypothetical protein
VWSCARGGRWRPAVRVTDDPALTAADDRGQLDRRGFGIEEGNRAFELLVGERAVAGGFNNSFRARVRPVTKNAGRPGAAGGGAGSTRRRIGGACGAAAARGARTPPNPARRTRATPLRSSIAPSAPHHRSAVGARAHHLCSGTQTDVPRDDRVWSTVIPLNRRGQDRKWPKATYRRQMVRRQLSRSSRPAILDGSRVSAGP